MIMIVTLYVATSILSIVLLALSLHDLHKDKSKVDTSSIVHLREKWLYKDKLSYSAFSNRQQVAIYYEADNDTLEPFTSLEDDE